jgi:DNA-binding transcriptional regulator GbsR (MarR family)
MEHSHMDEAAWNFIDATGEWWSKSYGIPRMTGRVMAWLLVCDPVEQTAAELADALGASKGSISGATTMLVRTGLVDRVHVRGERADRFRMRPDAWDQQIRDQGTAQARTVIAQGLEALAHEPPARRARLEELDRFYAWWESRMPALLDEWQEYKRTIHEGRRDA